ncbi:conserved hypothetical protein [Catenulispora acidiphila DSM 44928]|uniref:Uncharacterized protein n=2 Tax=Catenulispora TaxID=414878 RepID=C7QDE2_CATAD|nr:conserved hypothetical protein [Catenulispora acidiphila DSM 44928]
MGDRIAAVDARVRAQYGLDLASTWPRLWLLLSPAIREEVTRATEAWSRSGALAGWGLLYAAIGPWWWPCVLVGIAVFLIGWHAGRQAISELSVLVEAAVDVFGTELASALGVETPSGRLDAGSGRKITALLRKGS